MSSQLLSLVFTGAACKFHKPIHVQRTSYTVYQFMSEDEVVCVVKQFKYFPYLLKYALFIQQIM